MAHGVLLPQVSGVPRLPDAAPRLEALLRQRWAQPFEWGVNDCWLFVADAILAQTGVDPAAPLRSAYATAMGAGRIVHGIGGLERGVSSFLGPPLRSPMLACAGDVGLTGSGSLVLCIGERWVGPGARGLVLQPLAAAHKAWRVGCA